MNARVGGPFGIEWTLVGEAFFREPRHASSGRADATAMDQASLPSIVRTGSTRFTSTDSSSRVLTCNGVFVDKPRHRARSPRRRRSRSASSPSTPACGCFAAAHPGACRGRDHDHGERALRRCGAPGQRGDQYPHGLAGNRLTGIAPWGLARASAVRSPTSMTLP